MTDSLYKPTLPIEPGRYWWRQCTDGAEWFDTGETHMHRVRSAVRNGEFFE